MEVVSSEIQYSSPGMIEPEDIDLIALADKGIREAIAKSEGTVREMCLHIAGSGGKRIRPLLVLHSGLAFSAVNGAMIGAAVAAELIHMASLVHDDIIDKSELRRGKPSVNRKWGSHPAVLCGDWLFAEAFGILSGRGMGASMGFMVEAIQAMCHGEILQAAHRYNLDITVDAYYEQITKKTARLLESCCKAGASAGRAGRTGAKALGDYGMNIGLAFQIIDDILDFQGKPGVMGKPKGEDLRQGIITLPVILLLQDARFSGVVRKLLPKGRCSESDLEIINDLLAESGAMSKSYAIAGGFIDKALRSLDGLPDSRSKATLCELASGLRRRDN